MKGFKLDQYGDVVIKDGKIEIVEGVELVAQTVRQVVGTNLEEWYYDLEEGVDFYAILTKNPNYDLIQDTINTAVQHTADLLSVEIETGDYTFNVEGRHLTISFPMEVTGLGSTSVSVTL